MGRVMQPWCWLLRRQRPCFVLAARAASFYIGRGCHGRCGDGGRPHCGLPEWGHHVFSIGGHSHVLVFVFLFLSVSVSCACLVAALLVLLCVHERACVHFAQIACVECLAAVFA